MQIINRSLGNFLIFSIFSAICAIVSPSDFPFFAAERHCFAKQLVLIAVFLCSKVSCLSDLGRDGASFPFGTYGGNGKKRIAVAAIEKEIRTMMDEVKKNPQKSGYVA